MKDRPKLDLDNYAQNIFIVSRAAADLLECDGLKAEADEMMSRLQSVSSYDDVVYIIGKYVQVSQHWNDPGILEDDDVTLNPDSLRGVSGGGAAQFEIEKDSAARRFCVHLGSNDSIELWARVDHHLDSVDGEIRVTWSTSVKQEILPITLLPCEQQMILDHMKEAALEKGFTLDGLFLAWKSEHGMKQTHTKKKEKKNQHER